MAAAAAMTIRLTDVVEAVNIDSDRDSAVWTVAQQVACGVVEKIWRGVYKLSTQWIRRGSLKSRR